MKKPQQIEEQLYNVFFDSPIMKKAPFQGTKTNSNGLIKSFASKFGFFTTCSADSYCLINGNIPAKIIEFEENEAFKAEVFLSPKDYFLEPLPSKELGIFIVRPESFVEKTFKFYQICGKLVCLPYKNKQILVPLTHTVTTL